MISKAFRLSLIAGLLLALIMPVSTASADVASNYLTSVTPGACGGSSCVVNVAGKVTKVAGYYWSMYGVINYRTPQGTWAYCGPTVLDTLQIDGGYVHYHGMTSAVFARGQTYYVQTVLQLLNGQGQVVLTAYSNQVAVTIPGS